MKHGFVFPGDVMGGHEMMAAKILSALQHGGKRVLVLSTRAMYEKLAQFTGLNFEFVEVQFLTFRFESFLGYANPYYFKNKAQAKRYIAGLTSVTVVLGGVNSHHSTTLAIGTACAEMGIDARLYIPMFHSPKEMDVSVIKGFSNTRSAKRALGAVSTVLTIDEYWAERVRTFANRHSLGLQVIHNYLSRSIPNLAEVKIQNERKRFCVVGRMDKEQKGMDYVVNVLEVLSTMPELPPHTWVFIGDGPYLGEIKKFAKSCTHPNMAFEFCGWRKDSLTIMRTCDALVLTSRWEGIPTVVAEALMLNLSVFAFDIAAIDLLLVKDELIPCFDSALFAEKLRLYLGSKSTLINRQRPYLDMMCDESRFQQEVLSRY